MLNAWWGGSLACTSTREILGFNGLTGNERLSGMKLPLPFVSRKFSKDHLSARQADRIGNVGQGKFNIVPLATAKTECHFDDLLAHINLLCNVYNNRDVLCTISPGMSQEEEHKKKPLHSGRGSVAPIMRCHGVPIDFAKAHYSVRSDNLGTGT